MDVFRLLTLLLFYICVAEEFLSNGTHAECGFGDSSETCLASDTVSMLQTFNEIKEPLLHRSRSAIATKQQVNVLPQNRQRDIVWINAFARSGSSLIEAMITHSGSDPETDAFALFEPCHEGDRLSPELAAAGCPTLLSNIASCNFEGIESLWGWADRHTTNGGYEYFSRTIATRLCKKSKLIVVKTVDFRNNLQGIAFPTLNLIPHLRIVAVIRDPRAIWASRRATPGKFEGADCIHKMEEICDTFSANRNISDPRFMNLVYEDLVKEPTKVIHKVQSFLGRQFGPKQEDFIKANFNADCGDEKGDPYSVCRENSTAQLLKYRGMLDNDQFAAFMAHKQCREISSAYGYQPYYHHETACGLARKRFQELVDTPIFALGIAAFILMIMALCYSQAKNPRDDLNRAGIAA